MEVELKELLNDLQSIKKSISDPSHLALIDKMHLHAENIATLEKSGTTRRSKVKDMSGACR